MKEIIVPISDLPKMKKHLRVLIGKYVWRVNAYACIDHADYTPILTYWMSSGKKNRQHIEHPKFVNCFLTGDYVADYIQQGVIAALAENEDRAFVEGTPAADKIFKLAKDVLDAFQTEDDVVREVLDSENYMFFGTYDRILIYASFLHLHQRVSLGDALIQSEKKLDASLKNPQLYFEYWQKYYQTT